MLATYSDVQNPGGNAECRALIHLVDRITNGKLQRRILQESPEPIDSGQHPSDGMPTMGEDLTNRLTPQEPS